jgi:S-methylmethionine-dependent homocysteine/selenocysteine methylase
MNRYRDQLPQLSGDYYLTDAGIETDLMFNHGIEIREFAAHTLLQDDVGRAAVADYLRGYLNLAGSRNAGLILDSQTWKAHMHWAADLAATESELKSANEDSIHLISTLRDEFASNACPIVLNAVIGPRGDAYAPEVDLAVDEAVAYHSQQLGWLANTDVDMVTALTFTQASEAAGAVIAATRLGLPIVVSFTVETDGNLPGGQALGDAIEQVEGLTNSAAAYFMINCAHPDHFMHVLGDGQWMQRVRGIRCNASCKSHAELDESDTLDDGDPADLARQYQEIKTRMPWINVYGACCGADLRHVAAIADAVLPARVN